MSSKPTVISVRSNGEVFEVPLSMLANLPNLVNQVELLQKRIAVLEHALEAKNEPNV